MVNEDGAKFFIFVANIDTGIDCVVAFCGLYRVTTNGFQVACVD